MTFITMRAFFERSGLCSVGGSKRVVSGRKESDLRMRDIDDKADQDNDDNGDTRLEAELGA